MKRIFITGGNGFIGRNLRSALANNYEIVAPNRNDLNLLDEDKVADFLSANYFDVIIHTANQNASRNHKEDLSLVLERNLRMFYNLARCNAYFGKMLYYGSGAEYDMRYYKPMMREAYFGQHVPMDGYGFSKYVMSLYTAHASNIYDLRIFSVFGPYEDWEIRFISNACCKALFDLPITIKKNVFFDFLYIDDLVRITVWFIENSPNEKHYNICTGRGIDLVTLAMKIIDLSGKNLNIEIKEEGLKPEYSGNNEKLLSKMSTFGFTNIEVTLRKLYAWYESHQYLIDKEKLLYDK